MRNMAASSRNSSSFSHADTVTSLKQLSPMLLPASESALREKDSSKAREHVGDTRAMARHNSGRGLQKDSASGLLQRGNSASMLTGKTMSFVLRQKQMQEKQLTAMSRKNSMRSNGSDEDGYCRTLSSGEDVDDELSKYSADLDEVTWIYRGT